MAKLWLVAVLLLLSASVGSSVDPPDNQPRFERPDEAQIARIVKDLRNRYRPSYQSRFKNEKNEYPWKNPMFSLAVRIPYDNDMQRYDVSGVTDDTETVWRKIIGCDVYTSKTMVAATVLKWPNVLDQCPDARVPWQDVLNECRSKSMTWAKVDNKCSHAVTAGRADHAEYRVLNNFNTLMENRKQNDFLLFYVVASPCVTRCLSPNSAYNILESIRVIKQWTNYAVVFSDVFGPKEGDPVSVEKLKGGLEQLGKKVRLQNILRCDGSVPCTSCSSGKDVTPFCYDINAPKPAEGDNAPSTSVNVPLGGANASSKTGQKKKKKKKKKKKNNNNNNNNNENPGGSTNVDEGGRMADCW